MSNIDPSVPVYGVPTTQSVRDNFTVAKTEIEGLQSQITAITPAANGAVQKAGDTMTGLLLLSGAPSNPLGAATKAYVDGAISGSAAFLPITGGTMTGALTLSGAPTVDLHAATKAYVDTGGPAARNTGRNLLLNPSFNIWQRGTAFTTNTAYTADRWQLNFNLDTGVAVNQVVASDTLRGQIGDESIIYSFQTTVTGNAGAAAFTLNAQKLEDVRRLGGKTVTVSFWAWGSSGTPKLGASVDQNFGTGGSPSAQVTGTGQSVTLSTTATRYSLTFAVPSIVGKTLGTNNDHYTALNFWYSSGTTQASRAGSIGVQTGTLAIWGVQLEISSVASPLDYGGTIADQLRQCQRYYQTFQAQINGYTTAANNVGVTQQLPVPMRATPMVAGQSYSGSTNQSSPTIVAQTASVVLVNCAATATGQVILAAQATLSAEL